MFFESYLRDGASFFKLIYRELRLFIRNFHMKLKKKRNSETEREIEGEI
jgi:hypothetical protein